MAHAELRLVVANLALDEDDPVLGFTAGWVRALASRVAHVDVITMRAGRFERPANVVVRSLGKEHGRSEARRAVEFYRHLRAVRRDGVDAFFAHMAPTFTIMASPVLKAAGIPMVTWFAHPQRSAQLRVAHLLSDRMVTSFPAAYPFPGDKVQAIGQGIDTSLFTPAPDRIAAPPLVLYAGRLSPAKGVHTLLRAIAPVRASGAAPFRVAIVGGPAVPSDRAYVDQLHALRTELSLEEIVTFHDAVPFAELPGWYQQASVFVNLTPTGFGDKVALEAMASAVPCLTANHSFRDTLGAHADLLLFPAGDHVALAERLGRLLAMTPEERAAAGADLRAAVSERHSIGGLADRLVALFSDLQSGRRHGRGPLGVGP